MQSFKYLGSIFSSDALCGPEIKTRLASGARERFSKLAIMEKSNNQQQAESEVDSDIDMANRHYGAKSWTLNKELTVEAFEMQCYRKVLRIPYTGHVTNEVLQRMGQQRMLLGRVKSRKLKDFGHIALHQSLEHDLMFGGPVPGIRRQGGQRRQWFDDVTD